MAAARAAPAGPGTTDSEGPEARVRERSGGRAVAAPSGSRHAARSGPAREPALPDRGAGLGDWGRTGGREGDEKVEEEEAGRGTGEKGGPRRKCLSTARPRRRTTYTWHFLLVGRDGKGAAPGAPSPAAPLSPASPYALGPGPITPSEAGHWNL
uniref:Calcium-binding protein 1-like isoform X2 n=1 Tax=Phascolarctos cinereus TaxID=38626 RepID=A0A6P5KS02_PHACI|nr:calcium-binding protein 1-like isoform X2 [Phascolarctos cinereus]XP_020846884.1 calcium-binding protein 1-like isoform X2 [Phascolarctos cinereus]XP_020846885.1 calcium-binding protein 1-like isoform X2 [Phascolarctos cinereus]XP_020846886.1 calcium-binding protein 1-like isoform X2 [Phascolarctos cinereus]